MKRVIRNKNFGHFGPWVLPQNVIVGKGPNFPNQWANGWLGSKPTKVKYAQEMGRYLDRSLAQNPISTSETLVSGKSIGLYSQGSSGGSQGMGNIDFESFGLGSIQQKLDNFESATKITLAASIVGAVTGVLLLLKR